MSCHEEPIETMRAELVRRAMVDRDSARQFKQLLDAATDAAASHVRQHNGNAAQFEWVEGRDAVDLVGSIYWALTDVPRDRFEDREHYEAKLDEAGRRPVFWTHDHRPLDRVKRGEAPYIARASLEHITTRYLDFPWRAKEIACLSA